MRLHKWVRVPMKRFGVWWEGWALATKAVKVTLSSNETIRGLIEKGRYLDALAAAITGKKTQYLVPLEIMKGKNPEVKWRGDWIIPAYPSKMPIEPNLRWGRGK